MLRIKRFVFPKHYEHVFFHLDDFDEKWWFLIPFPTKGKMVLEKYLLQLWVKKDEIDVRDKLNVGDQIYLRV